MAAVGKANKGPLYTYIDTTIMMYNQGLSKCCYLP